MKVTIFGGGDLAEAFAAAIEESCDVTILTHDDMMARDIRDLLHDFPTDFAIVTSGLSDLQGASRGNVFRANLFVPMDVAYHCGAAGIPVLIVASTAGIEPGFHEWYGPAKAAVINFVRAAANSGQKIWAISPGRMDTKMRDRDFPEEDVRTRLDPALVAQYMVDIMDGAYAAGANVVIRAVGFEGRVDVYEQPRDVLPSLL